MTATEPYISDRKLDLCPTARDWPVSDLLKECPECHDFLLYCCSCSMEDAEKPEHLRSSRPCHHHRIVFTDGVCINNGKIGAKAGVGIAYGSSGGSQMSLSVKDTLDNASLRSNQRAELLAAKHGLRFLAEAHEANTKGSGGNEANDTSAWIIATDSEYIAKGMTEWLPSWQKNNWRTSKGTIPANLDLFLALDGELAKYEAKNIVIGFWCIPREANTLADGLAKVAALRGHVATK